MIDAFQLAKTFPAKGRKKPVVALQDVSFAARDGEITGLLGPNGAGKSTTLRILAGLVRPDSGSAQVDGREVVSEPGEIRRTLGFLPHNAGLYPRLTARENMAYYGHLYGLSRGAVKQRIDTLVEQLEMQAFADRRAEGFSQGQRTKVALGRALIHEPQTLILDEPTNGLDVMATRNLRKILRELRDAGHCILVSSHIMQEVARLCDGVAIISEGRVAMAAPLDDILLRTGQQDLEDAFVVAIGESLEGGV